MSTTSAGITSVPDSADIYLDLAERDILRVKLQPHRREERGFSFLHRVVVEKPPGARFTLLKCNLLEVSFCSEFSICTSSLVTAESISADSICSRCPHPITPVWKIGRETLQLLEGKYSDKLETRHFLALLLSRFNRILIALNILGTFMWNGKKILLKVWSFEDCKTTSDCATATCPCREHVTITVLKSTKTSERKNDTTMVQKLPVQLKNKS